MKPTFKFVGMTLGSALGWWIGDLVGLMTAVLLSAVGGGLGLWAANWAGREWME